MITAPCECEHPAHIHSAQRTPLGNPGHKYGQHFNVAVLRVAFIAYEEFLVCPDCWTDCEANEE